MTFIEYYVWFSILLTTESIQPHLDVNDQQQKKKITFFSLPWILWYSWQTTGQKPKGNLAPSPRVWLSSGVSKTSISEHMLELWYPYERYIDSGMLPLLHRIWERTGNSISCFALWRCRKWLANRLPSNWMPLKWFAIWVESSRGEGGGEIWHRRTDWLEGYSL